MNIYIFTFLIAFDLASAQLAAHGRRLGLNIGSAINAGLANSNAKYGALIKDNANMVVAENDCKLHMIRTSSGGFDFSNCDRARGFAKNNGMKFRGHTLVWYKDLDMPWLGGDASKLRGEIVNHITTVLNHYKGDPDFRYWDVVNEALAENPDGGKTGYRQAGVLTAVPDYVDLAFITARKVDPTLRLFYNDYSTQVFEWGHFQNQLIMVKDMLARGVPIDGVGFQAHIEMDGKAYTVDSVKKAFAPFVDLGLEIHITELDVKCPPGSCDKTKQADFFKAFFQACVETAACTTVMMWGLTDAVYFDKGAGALIFDEGMQAKPAFNTLNAYLAGLQSIPPRKFGNVIPVTAMAANPPVSVSVSASSFPAHVVSTTFVGVSSTSEMLATATSTYKSTRAPSDTPASSSAIRRYNPRPASISSSILMALSKTESLITLSTPSPSATVTNSDFTGQNPSQTLASAATESELTTSSSVDTSITQSIGETTSTDIPSQSIATTSSETTVSASTLSVMSMTISANITPDFKTFSTATSTSCTIQPSPTPRHRNNRCKHKSKYSSIIG